MGGNRESGFGGGKGWAGEGWEVWGENAMEDRREVYFSRGHGKDMKYVLSSYVLLILIFLPWCAYIDNYVRPILSTSISSIMMYKTCRFVRW